MSSVERILSFHLLGLQRVSRVIDANANYDELMEHRLGESQWTAFDPDISLSARCDAAIKLFDKKFRSRKPKVIFPEFSGFACEGRSHNNIREFRFFERICAPAGIEILRSNYADCETVAVTHLTDEQKRARAKVSADVAQFYASRSDITASLVRQQILYSRSFFNFLMAFTQPGAVLPLALVQANDHSPVRVALSMVMKGLRVPRIYLQHAEVTQNFPPLDFEYSVLRNARSRETYENIGPVDGDVFVIAREEQEFAQERLFKPRDTGVTVAIYPTARVRIDQILRIIEILRQNLDVRKIIVKQHPAASKQFDDRIEGSGAVIANGIPEEDHIAIVGNSSITIELLHRGIPVFQNFDFDPVATDYYGFVAKGLTYQTAIADLSVQFWRTYPPSDRWIDSYLQWDPTAAPDYLAEEARFIESMTNLAKDRTMQLPAPARRAWLRGRWKARTKTLAKRLIIRAIHVSPRLSGFVANRGLQLTDRFARFLLVNTQNGARFFQLYTDLEVKAPTWQDKGRNLPSPLPGQALLDFIEHTLSSVERPIHWLQLNESTDTFTNLAIVSTLDQMFQKRNVALRKIFRDYAPWEPASPVATWIHLKKTEWSNTELADSELCRIAAFIYAYRADARVKSTLESMLLTALLRLGSCEHLDTFWATAELPRDSLSINRKISLLRKLRSVPGREGEVEMLRSRFEQQATRFEALKLKNADIMDGNPTENCSHKDLEEAFESAAPAPLVREFAAEIRPVYESLRPRMRFMDVRAQPQLASEFMELVGRAIVDKAPFSLIRLSDGEGYLFPERHVFRAEDTANRERHWWGIELPPSLKETIVREARRAIGEADVVGIPAMYRIIRDSGDTSTSLVRSLQGRGLVEVLHGVSQAISPQALITEDKVNVALFRDVHAIAPLAERAGKVIVVTSAKKESLPKALTAGRSVVVINIPTHHKTSLNDKYHTASQPLPFLYRSVLEKLDDSIGPGDLVLVAGGIVGKIFIGHVRSRGAVALDVGHTLDDWMHGQVFDLR